MDDSGWSAADDAHAAIAGYGPHEPFFSALAFMSGLGEGTAANEDLGSVVTPESAAAWGDFEEARSILRDIGDCGMGSYPTPATGAPDVAYVTILRDVQEGYRVTEDTLVLVPAVLTLVWRPERGFWLVHHLGQPVQPEDVPRTSPGVAPDYTRAP